MEQVLERNPAIVWRMVHDEAVLLSPQNGEYFGLNEVGSAFWAGLDGRKTVGELVAGIMGEYDVPQDVLEADLLELIVELKTKGLVREPA